jgi:hypothetical protein
MATDVGVVTTTADGTVLFDSRDENLFLYRSRTWTANAPASTTYYMNALAGYSVIPIITSVDSYYTSSRGRAIQTVTSYEDGYPKVYTAINGSGKFSIKMVYMQSNRLRSTYE